MKKKNNKFIDILNIYLKWKPPKIFVFFVLFIFFLLVNIIYFRIDNDFWFLINCGKYILKNGFPVVDPFTIHSDLVFIVQQWLTDIIFYIIYSKLGAFGLFIFMGLLGSLILYLIYKLCLFVSENNIKISILITCFISFALNRMFITTRPQVFDIILLLLELYLIELFEKYDNKLYLIGFPILSLLMINLHSSLWLMLFVFLIPYCIEKLIHKKKRELILIIFTMIIMFLVGFINPYGFESIRYLFNSYGIPEVNLIIQEMLPINISDAKGYFLLIFVVICSFYYNKSNNKIRYILLALGTCYLGLSHFKGILFFLVSSVIVLGYNFKNIFIEEDIQKKYYISKCINVFIILFMCIGVLLYVDLLSDYNFNKEEQLYLYEIANYLDENVDKDIKLFTTYDEGGYLEYRGYKCYIDPRAEIFLKSNNKKEDIFIEFYDLVKNNLDYEVFLSKYDFDYLLVSNRYRIYDYLEYNNNYDIIYEKEFDGEIYRIYKKKDSNYEKNS